VVRLWLLWGGGLGSPGELTVLWNLGALGLLLNYFQMVTWDVLNKEQENSPKIQNSNMNVEGVNEMEEVFSEIKKFISEILGKKNLPIEWSATEKFVEVSKTYLRRFWLLFNITKRSLGSQTQIPGNFLQWFFEQNKEANTPIQNWNSLLSLFWKQMKIPLVEQWLGHVRDLQPGLPNRISCDLIPSGINLFLGRSVVPPTPTKLLKLPLNFSELMLSYLSTVCSNCNSKPKRGGFCLVCGKFLCVGSICCAQDSVGEAAMVKKNCYSFMNPCSTHQSVEE
jgi:hypothetical protein